MVCVGILRAAVESNNMLRVGIIGCGKIADVHASQIQRIGGCELVAVCDREELMAQQLSERFRVPRYFSEVAEFLDSSKLDVVHITTPPQSHFELAELCLERRCHVYVEKPFTLRAWEAEELINLANANSLKLTAGHNAQFTHAARRMRQLVREGYLGGPAVHLESLYCYQLDGDAYAKAVLASKRHWVRELPGGLLNNIISHGIAKLAEFLTADSQVVSAYGFVSPSLRRRGEKEIIDELRVMVRDADCTTASFVFSSQMRPLVHQFRVWGPQNALVVDHDQQTVIKVRGSRYKSYLQMFVPPLNFASQYAANVWRNAGLFLARDFHMESGVKNLIESFYRSIADEQAVPIPYREILLTARLMDDIFQQLSSQRSFAQSMGAQSNPRSDADGALIVRGVDLQVP
jgi:predicted dehydrogenase